MTGKRPINSLPAAQQAGILCGQDQFRAYLAEAHAWPLDQDPAEFVRTHCEVSSRRDFETDQAARNLWEQLRNSYDAWRGKIAGPQR